MASNTTDSCCKPASKAPSPATTTGTYDADSLKSIVDDAMQRARSAGNPNLAAAVHEIWFRSLSDQRLRNLLEVVLLQEATAEQIGEFQGYVREAKRHLVS